LRFNKKHKLIFLNGKYEGQATINSDNVDRCSLGESQNQSYWISGHSSKFTTECSVAAAETIARTILPHRGTGEGLSSKITRCSNNFQAALDLIQSLKVK